MFMAKKVKLEGNEVEELWKVKKESKTSYR